MLLRRFEMPWRPTYEGYSALGWLACLVMMLREWRSVPGPKEPFAWLAAISALFLLWNARRAWRLWSLKASLGGKGISFITDQALAKKVKEKPGNIWMGWGFDWTPEHTQRLYEMKRIDPRQFYPPRLYMALKEWATGVQIGANAPEYIGAPWIHGLEPREVDLRVAIQNFIGNLLVLGTNRCGKTRLLELICEMAVLLGYTLIVIDPKGDQEWEGSIKTATRMAGRAGDYCRMHLAFPRSGIRIDPLANFNNPSDLATRIAALMPGGERAASFRDFAWSVLNAIILGMIELGEKPTLVVIRGYVNNGVADLLLRVLLKYLDELLPPNWEQEVAAFARTLRQPKGKQADEGEINVRGSLNLLLAYYVTRLVAAGHTSEAVETLATIFRHEAAHYTKMIATLKPIMSMLTTGELGPLLSPDPADVSDQRPMTDLLSLIRSNAVVYIGLDSLANKTIASAVGALLLSDLTSAAAVIYNFDPPRTDRQRIFLVVDEAAEVVNPPYLAMLNKSPGAGFVNIATLQTVSDLAARLESQDLALQALGNFNNLVAMRLKDQVSQEFVTRVLGETFVHAKQVIMGTTTGTADNLAHFSGSVQERVTETMEDFLPPDVLGQMPNWQYIGAFSGGRVIKGRLPIIRHANQ